MKNDKDKKENMIGSLILYGAVFYLFFSFLELLGSTLFY